MHYLSLEPKFVIAVLAAALALCLIFVYAIRAPYLKHEAAKHKEEQKKRKLLPRKK